MRNLIVFFSLFTLLGFSQTLEIDEIKAIDNGVYSKIIESSLGDLDGDSIKELMLILNRFDESENNIERDLIILKMYNSSWQVWKKSTNTILGTEDGGIRGDPFQWAYIDSNKIYISHAGGSRWRWTQNYVYSFVNNVFLLNSFYSYWGALCEDKTEVDFNLASGKVSYSIAVEDCPEGFGNNSHLIESLPIKEDFFHKDLKIDLFSENDTIVDIITPLNNTFSIY